jgi:hypothetical protein
MTPIPSRLPTPLLLAFGLVNLPLSMLMSPTAAVLLPAWRYPLGRRAHGILARRLATRQEMQA